MTGRVVVLVGVPGAGKSRYISDRWPGLSRAVVSTDDLRARVADDESDQDASADAVQLQHTIGRMRLRRGLFVVADSTHIFPAYRRAWLDIAAETGAVASAVLLATPLVVCLERNARRPGPRPGRRYGRQVPEELIREWHAALPTAEELADEGFRYVETIAPGYHGFTLPAAGGGAALWTGEPPA